MYHLKFSSGTGDGKGLAVKGPPDMVGVPNELTIAMWVRPDVLLAKSYFVNAFSRLYLYSQASD
jgi:hypothetical protein